MSPLEPTLQHLAAQAPATVGLYAHHLGTQQSIAIGADQTFPTLSAGKTLILLAYAEGVVAGRLDPIERVRLEAHHLLPGTGALRYCGPGLGLTLSDLAHLMIAFSDNVATNLLLTAVGGVGAVNETINRLGIVGAEIRSPIMQGEFCLATPKALAHTYVVLADPEGHAYAPQAAELAKNILRRHQDLEGLSRYLPWSPHAIDFNIPLPLTVYSKSGQFPGSFTEAGLFVAPSGSYVLAVMSRGWPEPQLNSTNPGSTLLAQVGRLVFETWGGGS